MKWLEAEARVENAKSIHELDEIGKKVKRGISLLNKCAFKQLTSAEDRELVMIDEYMQAP